jgi:hypothetical protein
MQTYQYLIVCGRPDAGQRYIGPFSTEEAAIHYAETGMQAVEWWWICTLESEV